jgi:hypothetical protein
MQFSFHFSLVSAQMSDKWLQPITESVWAAAAEKLKYGQERVNTVRRT